MPKVQRIVVADGDQHLIECAVRSDGVTSPVATLLEELKEGRWPLEGSGLAEPDECVAAHASMLAVCEFLAENGVLPNGRTKHNQLWDGIWELKWSNLRVTLFDTDGSGGFTPKIDRIGQSDWGPPPWPQDFDDYIRLATGFYKETPRTPEAEIALAQTVREEDLDHDREEA